MEVSGTATTSNLTVTLVGSCHCGGEDHDPTPPSSSVKQQQPSPPGSSPTMPNWSNTPHEESGRGSKEDTTVVIAQVIESARHVLPVLSRRSELHCRLLRELELHPCLSPSGAAAGLECAVELFRAEARW
ncbi:hypothetical protein E2562_012099 [Oryza meyeriana var. granulata]|uniref:Uncharacterized protein n=1 Tax=Oryza meyeriana var. granulata TaxID=110450 RepID=A0A6G1F7E7_9ORYZ|nr:hypothetical protein E2562_012099 [Oryza meyeriana var. granulata]